MKAIPDGIAPAPQYVPLRFPGFDVTCAGPHPLMPGFCFGSEDGRLLLTDEGGSIIGEPGVASPSRQAINGIAYSGTCIGVTTREEVTVLSLTPSANGKPSIVVFPQGAHGITTTRSGRFAAPAGRAGILLLTPSSDPNEPVELLGPKDAAMYFYRLSALRGMDAKDLLVCACRRGGIALAETTSGQGPRNMRVAGFDGLDIVDVCPVSTPAAAPAVAGLGIDGTLILIRDILGHPSIVTMKFSTVRGMGYRVHCYGDHLVVLTTNGLYLLAMLAGRLASGMESGTFKTQILAVPLEAVDASLIHDRWMLVIMPDEVRKVDLSILTKNLSEGVGNGQADSEESLQTTLSPSWKTYETSQHSRQHALA